MFEELLQNFWGNFILFQEVWHFEPPWGRITFEVLLVAVIFRPFFHSLITLELLHIDTGNVHT